MCDGNCESNVRCSQYFEGENTATFAPSLERQLSPGSCIFNSINLSISLSGDTLTLTPNPPPSGASPTVGGLDIHNSDGTCTTNKFSFFATSFDCSV